jgi:phage gpG-like protein
LISVTITGTIPEVNTDLSERMVEVADIMQKAIELNFTMGGRPFAWPALAPPRGGTPLVASGGLYQSIESEGGDTWAETSVGKDWMPLRSRKKRSASNVGAILRALHGKDWGTFTMTGRNHAARLPARPFMVLTDFDVEKIGDVILRDFIITKNIGEA